MAITKTLSYSVTVETMPNFDGYTASGFGYDPIVNAGETNSQFTRRIMRQKLFEAYMAGKVKASVDPAEETAINSLGTIT